MTKDLPILVVDDDPAMLELSCRLLGSLGYRNSVRAHSAAEAIAVLEAPSRESIALVLSDFQMPGMNGDDLALYLRRQLPSLPCLLMSGAPPDFLKSKVPLQEGVNFLSKPLAPAPLKNTIAEALAANLPRTSF
jgi:CheY-like chemotaxis protein